MIKIEAPGGDMWRNNAIKLAPKGQKYGTLFENTNRGKRSVILDLKKKDDKEILLRLLDKADVFLTNVRVKGLQRLGLDYETIRNRFPRLIYAHLTAWGRAGPHRDDAGYDAGAFWAAVRFTLLIQQCFYNNKQQQQQTDGYSRYYQVFRRFATQ